MRLARGCPRIRRLPAATALPVASAAMFGAISVVLGVLTLLTSDRTSATAALSAVVIAVGPLIWAAAWVGSGWLNRLARTAADVTRRLECAAATGHELVWEATAEGVVTYMSDVAREMFGVDPDDLVGQSVFLVLPPDEQVRARAMFAESVREKRGWTGLTFQALHTDGVLRWVETTSVAHLDHHGQVQGFTATTRRLDPRAVERLALDRIRERVMAVLTDHRLHTVFQPIVDVDSGRVVGHEALTRFDAEPAQPPDRWFIDAETVGLAVDLDCLSIQTALFAAQRLPQDTYVSVNVTPPTIESRRLDGLLRAAGVPGDRIVMEITEHVSVDDYQSLREPFEALRAMGVRLAVDDAGAGYASFRHILRLRPDFIKLDQEIIRGIHDDPARRALAAAVVMFSLDVGAQVIAEGVETPEDLLMVATLGVDAAQGFLLGRPSDDPREWRRAQRPTKIGRVDSAV